jgi:hypothetical protein
MQAAWDDYTNQAIECLYRYEACFSAFSYWEGYKKFGKGLIAVKYPISSKRGDDDLEVYWVTTERFRELLLPRLSGNVLDRRQLKSLRCDPNRSFYIMFFHPVTEYFYIARYTPTQAPRNTTPAQLAEFVI